MGNLKWGARSHGARIETNVSVGCMLNLHVVLVLAAVEYPLLIGISRVTVLQRQGIVALEMEAQIFVWTISNCLMTRVAFVIHADAFFAISIPQALNVIDRVTSLKQLLFLDQTLGAVLCSIETVVAVIIDLCGVGGTEENSGSFHCFANDVQSV